MLWLQNKYYNKVLTKMGLRKINLRNPMLFKGKFV